MIHQKVLVPNIKKLNLTAQLLNTISPNIFCSTVIMYITDTTYSKSDVNKADCM